MTRGRIRIFHWVQTTTPHTQFLFSNVVCKIDRTLGPIWARRGQRSSLDRRRLPSPLVMVVSGRSEGQACTDHSHAVRARQGICDWSIGPAPTHASHRSRILGEPRCSRMRSNRVRMISAPVRAEDLTTAVSDSALTEFPSPRPSPHPPTLTCTHLHRTYTLLTHHKPSSTPCHCTALTAPLMS